MVKCRCSKGLYYNHAISQVFRILSNITKANTWISIGIWRWETWRSIRGNVFLLYQDIICSTLTPSFQATLSLATLVFNYQLLSFLLPVPKCPLQVAYQLILSGWFIFLCALYLWIISYALKREFSFYLLNYPYIMNEIIHNNLFLIRKRRVSEQNDGVLKNWTIVE